MGIVSSLNISIAKIEHNARFLVVVIHHYIAKVIKAVTFAIHLVNLVTVVPNGDCKTIILSIIELMIANFESISSCGNTEQHCTSGGSTTRLSTLITTSSSLSSSTSNTPSFMSTTNVPISSTSSLISTTNVPISSTSSPMSTTNVPSTSSLMSTTSTLPVTSTTGNQEPTMTRERFDCIFSLLSPNVRDQRWQGKSERVNS